MAQTKSGASANSAPLPAAGDADTERIPAPAILRALRNDWHGRIELKRQNTSRGTPEESTQTTLRIETFFDGPLSVLRVDLPFPDEKTDFEGDPFSPRPR